MRDPPSPDTGIVFDSSVPVGDPSETYTEVHQTTVPSGFQVPSAGSLGTGTGGSPRSRHPLPTTPWSAPVQTCHLSETTFVGPRVPVQSGGLSPHLYEIFTPSRTKDSASDSPTSHVEIMTRGVTEYSVGTGRRMGHATDDGSRVPRTRLTRRATMKQRRHPVTLAKTIPPTVPLRLLKRSLVLTYSSTVPREVPGAAGVGPRRPSSWVCLPPPSSGRPLVLGSVVSCPRRHVSFGTGRPPETAVLVVGPGPLRGVWVRKPLTGTPVLEPRSRGPDPPLRPSGRGGKVSRRMSTPGGRGPLPQSCGSVPRTVNLDLGTSVGREGGVGIEDKEGSRDGPPGTTVVRCLPLRPRSL